MTETVQQEEIVVTAPQSEEIETETAEEEISQVAEEELEEPEKTKASVAFINTASGSLLALSILLLVEGLPNLSDPSQKHWISILLAAAVPCLVYSFAASRNIELVKRHYATGGGKVIFAIIHVVAWVGPIMALYMWIESFSIYAVAIFIVLVFVLLWVSRRTEIF